MKNNLEIFNEYCGIAKIENAEKEIYVVYSDYMPCKKYSCEHIGNIYGKGETLLDALKEAVINFNEHIRSNYEQFDLLEEKIKKIQFNRSFEKIVVPIESWEYSKENDYTIVDSGIFHNADVFINQQGKPELGLA